MSNGSQGIKAFRRRCLHPILQIVEFNPLGALTGCVLCEEALQLTEEEMGKYYAFTYTSPQGGEHDVHVLMAEDLIK